MIITLDEAKLYLRLDNDEEDDLIESLIEASESYLKNATGITFNDSNPLAKLFCLTLITDWYETRGLTVGKVEGGVRNIIMSMLAQLNYSYPEA